MRVIALADVVPGFEAEARELVMTLEMGIEAFVVLAGRGRAGEGGRHV